MGTMNDFTGTIRISSVQKVSGTVSLARIIHERFCCNRVFAAATSLTAGVLAAQSFDVLFQVRLSPSQLCLPVSQRDSTISRRTVMNNVG
jgi:hypothetical protein